MPEEEEVSCCFTVKLIANLELAVVGGVTVQTVEVKRVETGKTRKFNFYGGGVGVGIHGGLSVGESDPVCCSKGNCPDLADFAGGGSIGCINISVLLGGGYIWITFDNVGDCGSMSFSMGVGNAGLGGLYFGKNWGKFVPR